MSTSMNTLKKLLNKYSRSKRFQQYTLFNFTLHLRKNLLGSKRKANNIYILHLFNLISVRILMRENTYMRPIYS